MWLVLFVVLTIPALNLFFSFHPRVARELRSLRRDSIQAMAALLLIYLIYGCGNEVIGSLMGKALWAKWAMISSFLQISSYLFRAGGVCLPNLAWFLFSRRVHAEDLRPEEVSNLLESCRPFGGRFWYYEAALGALLYGLLVFQAVLVCEVFGVVAIGT